MATAQQLTGLDCDGPVQAAVSLVLSTGFDEMFAFRNAALDWSDPEGVHDMRVAVRRLRSALRDFGPYLASQRVLKSRRHIRDLARVLGRVRDYDVAIIKLERIAEKAPAEIVGGIRRFAQFRSIGRGEARMELLPALNSELLLELRARFKKALRPGTLSQTRKSRNQTRNVTYREVAPSIVLDHLDRLEKFKRQSLLPVKNQTTAQNANRGETPSLRARTF